MNLDLRIPMGLMFTFIGVVLTAFGASTGSDYGVYVRSLGINVNLWWGVVLLVFGLTMYSLGIRSQKRVLRQPAEPTNKPRPRRKTPR